MLIRLIRQTVALPALLLTAAIAFAHPQNQIALIYDAEGRPTYVNAAAPAVPDSAPIETASAAPGAGPGMHKLIRQTAESLEVDPNLVEAVVEVESGYHPHARSSKGALGLMQLMPATAARFGVGNPFDPAQNIRGGVTYLGRLLKQFNRDVPLSLAAYNAGEGAVLRERGIPPFQETRDYVRKVTALYPLPPESSHSQAATFKNEASARPSTADNSAASVPIYQYADSQGVLHFTQ